MDLKRMVTALIGLPAIILVILMGNQYIVGLLIFVASIICMHEYFEAVKKVSKPIEWIGYLTNAWIIGAIFYDSDLIIHMIVYSIPFIMLLLFMQVIITEMQITFKDVAYTLVGIFYIPFFLIFLQLIRNMHNGKILVGYTFIVSWSTDIFAYLVGRKFGKHKFSKVSPKKSIEGCISGTIGSTIIAIVYTILIEKYVKINYSYLTIALISICLSIVSQIGDFVASSIKRFVDIKDYGNLLPGHGGMLDRIDSLLFLQPFAYLLLTFVL